MYCIGIIEPLLVLWVHQRGINIK